MISPSKDIDSLRNLPEGSGIGGAEKSLREHCPKANWKQGRLVNSGAAAWGKVSFWESKAGQAKDLDCGNDQSRTSMERNNPDAARKFREYPKVCVNSSN